MGYVVVNKAVRNSDVEASQQEFSRRSQVLVIAQSYLRYELGLGVPHSLTTDYCRRLVDELQLRQVLKSKDVIKAIDVDYARDAVRIYICNPDYDTVPENTKYPEIWVD